MSEEEIFEEINGEESEDEVEDIPEEIFTLEEYSLALEHYFKSFNGFFINEASKGIFLLGVATGKLLQVQSRRFKSKEALEPFWRSLYNLTLNKKRLMAIHLKVLTKLKQYQKNKYPKKLLQTISDYIMKTGDDFGLSDLEMSWYFALGISSHHNVTNKNLKNYLSNK